MSHVEDLVLCLNKHTADPHSLPASSEQVIKDIKGIDYSSIVGFKVIDDRLGEEEDFSQSMDFRLHHRHLVH